MIDLPELPLPLTHIVVALARPNVISTGVEDKDGPWRVTIVGGYPIPNEIRVHSLEQLFTYQEATDLAKRIAGLARSARTLLR